MRGQRLFYFETALLSYKIQMMGKKCETDPWQQNVHDTTWNLMIAQNKINSKVASMMPSCMSCVRNTPTEGPWQYISWIKLP